MPRTQIAVVTQARHYQGQLVKSAVDSVIDCLISIGKLPQGYSPKQIGSNGLARKTRVLFGREEELARLRERLCDPKHFPAAVIRGGCGDGKSALAMELGMQMWEAGELPGGAYLIDLAGKYSPAIPCILAQENATGQASNPLNCIVRLQMSQMIHPRASRICHAAWIHWCSADCLPTCYRAR